MISDPSPTSDAYGAISTRRAVSPVASMKPVSAVPSVKLSILMPVYNEQRTIAQAVLSILSTDYGCDFELIVVDDGSSDATPSILEVLDHAHAKVFRHPQNRGKGAALLTGAQYATGTHLVPFDADLEYDPTDLAAMVKPVLDGRCDVVYGTRLLGANTRYQSFRHAAGNRAMTLAANVLFDACLNDLHTCLKLMPVRLFGELDLCESGFGLDTEITAKLLKLGIRPFEVPVSYHSRSFANGKKITWRDGVECLRVLARVRCSATVINNAGASTIRDPFDTLIAPMDVVAELSGTPAVASDPALLPSAASA